MNHLKAVVEHKFFITSRVERFNLKMENNTVLLYSEYDKLHIEILGRKTIAKLRTLFFDILSLLFIYLGSSPKICELIENGQSIDIAQFSSKYTPSKRFSNKEACLCPINNTTINEKVLKLFLNISKMPINSLQFLLCEAYDKLAQDHRITLLLHIIDGIVSKAEVQKAKTYLCGKYPQIYNIKTIGNYLPAVYHLCQNYFFNYHRKFKCDILQLLKVTQLKFVQISADTRNWYSHFLEESKKPNRLKCGEEMIFWFDILHYAIRLMIVSELKVSIDEGVVKEYYYILHDWILKILYGKEDNLKSNTYSFVKSFREMFENTIGTVDKNSN